MASSLVLAFLLAALLLPACSHVSGAATVTAIGFSGVWRLNRDRSDIPPVTKGQLLTIETDGDHVAMREVLVNDKDETLTIAVEGRFDGIDYPVSGTPFADTVSYRLLAPNVIEGIAKKGGRVVVKETAVLAADGLSVTVTYVSFDDHGKSFANHGIFERVSH